MNLHQAYLGMIREIGWDAMCERLNMSRAQLENHIYGRQGQGVRVDTALDMQAASGTKLYAEATASISGGTFVVLPIAIETDKDEMLAKFNKLHTAVGLLSQRYTEYTEDNEVDKTERANLITIGDEISKSTQELLSLTFRLFCAPEQGAPE